MCGLKTSCISLFLIHVGFSLLTEGVPVGCLMIPAPFSQQREENWLGNLCTSIALISYDSKVMLKILQARLQQFVNCELPDVQAGFRKGRGNIDQIANICWIREKAREFQKKHLLLLYWLCQNLWLCGSLETVEKVLKGWEYQTTWPASWETCMQVIKQQLELDMEQQTGSK